MTGLASSEGNATGLPSSFSLSRGSLFLSEPSYSHDLCKTSGLHVPLNAYLHKFKSVDKPQCPACGAGKEDAEHFLLNCPAYAHERWALSQSAKKKKKLLTMESLFGDKDLTIPLADFVEATFRFSQQTQHPSSSS